MPHGRVDIADYLDMISIFLLTILEICEHRLSAGRNHPTADREGANHHHHQPMRSLAIISQRITGIREGNAEDRAEQAAIDGGRRLSIANHRVDQVQKLLARHCATHVLDDLSQCCRRVGRTRVVWCDGNFGMAPEHVFRG
jgi:hypothetical protein